MSAIEDGPRIAREMGSRVSDIEHGYVEPTDAELARFTGTRW